MHQVICGWMTHNLESRMLGEISITSICRWYHPNGRMWRGTKQPPDEGVRGEWKTVLKLNIQNAKIMASSSITSWQIDGEKMETVSDYIFFFWLQSHCRWLLSSVQLVTQLCPTLCDPMNYSMPGLPVHRQLPEFTQIYVHWVGDAIKPSHPLLSPSWPALNLSSIRVFSNKSALSIRWPKFWSFNFNISPSNEHPGLISFRMDWLNLTAVQGTLKSLLQHHSSKASILWHSAFFIVQISHPYMTTDKTIDLTRWTFVDKVMSLLFNMLSRLVITFLPRSKHLLISWLQSHHLLWFWSLKK